MRLTCPNCSAQYEVDEKVIPRGGRDVQCSACGHTWYQYPMDVALQMRAAELDDDDDDDDEDGAPKPASGADTVEGAPRAAPRIDKTVLDVLREEAERELTERKRAQAGLETQGDLGLARPTRSKAAPPRVYGENDPTPPPVEPLPEDEPDDTPKAPQRRRSLLPDIEELSSTLEPGSERRAADDDDQPASAADTRGFRRGLSVVMLVAAALVALYVLAPVIVGYVPATRPVLAAYVGVIDGLRATVAGLLRGLFGG